MKHTIQNLKRALRVLENGRQRILKGWCQFHLAEGPIGQVLLEEDPDVIKWCALGALQTSVTDDPYVQLTVVEPATQVNSRIRQATPENVPTYEAMQCTRKIAHDYLRKSLPTKEGGFLLTDYNDAEGRTKEEIVALYDRAISAVRLSIDTKCLS